MLIVSWRISFSINCTAHIEQIYDTLDNVCREKKIIFQTLIISETIYPIIIFTKLFDT